MWKCAYALYIPGGGTHVTKVIKEKEAMNVRGNEQRDMGRPGETGHGGTWREERKGEIM